MKLTLQVLTLFLLQPFWQQAALSEETYQSLMSKYAELSLIHEGDRQLEAPLKELLDTADRYSSSNPGNAEAWIATSRIRFGYANTQGPLSGFRLLKQAKDEMERAIQIDPIAQKGFPQGFLGYLYAGVPSWPISFGSDRKSLDYFEEAFRIDSASIEVNYFFAVIQVAAGNSELALHHLNRAAESLNILANKDFLHTMYERNIEALMAEID